MSIETMTKLATVTVGAGGSANVTFSNIPQTYTDLRIIYSSRDTNANGGNAFANINLTINGDSLTNYSSLLLYGLGTSVGYSNLPSASGIGVLYHPSSSATSSTFSSNEVNFLNYSGSNHKIIISDGNALTNSASPFNYLTVGKWTNTSAITSINLQSMTLFNQHSTFTLYGIKNVAKAAGNSIKATGGAISFDGTYVYHTFNTTSTFVTNQSVVADLLLVAGGGGGHGAYSGGTTSTQGNNTVFGSLTAAVGGGRGGLDNGGNGGSGGGAGTYNNNLKTGGSGTAGQGNAGGNAGSFTGNNVYQGGGGGGATAAGTYPNNYPSNYLGNGGNGSSAYSSWGLATNTGQNVSGTYWFAGGGGGGTDSSISYRSSGGNGGGGAGGYGGSGGSNGTANTGGGGGGGSNGGNSFGAGGGGAGGLLGFNSQFFAPNNTYVVTVGSGGAGSGSGGSGIAIVRYKA